MPQQVTSLADRAQVKWLSIFLLAAISTFVVTDLLARNRGLEHWTMAKSSEFSARNGKLFSNTGNFTDYEERILLDEIPNTNFNEGGIFFFGTSNMKWAFTTWDLPTNLRTRLHNYGIGASTHQTTFRLVRYFIDRGSLSAARNSEVVIGASFHLGATEDANSYFSALVRRQGLYEIRPDDRLHETNVGPLVRWWRIEKARSSGLIWNMVRLANNGVLAHFRLSSQPAHDPEVYRAGWRSFMGENWRSSTDRQIDYLAKTIVLLHSKNIPVKIILLPQGTWMSDLPYGSYYDSKVRALGANTGTPVLDWSKSLPDSDFIDSNHLALSGQTKFRNMMLREEAARLHN